MRLHKASKFTPEEAESKIKQWAIWKFFVGISPIHGMI